MSYENSNCRQWYGWLQVLRKTGGKEQCREFEITVFGEEIRPAYDRVHLSEYFAGKSAEDLTLASAEWYHDNYIDLYLGDPIQHIDRDA